MTSSDPLIACPTPGCRSLVAADIGVCAACRRRSGAPNALPAVSCYCERPIVDHLHGRRWAA